MDKPLEAIFWEMVSFNSSYAEEESFKRAQQADRHTFSQPAFESVMPGPRWRRVLRTKVEMVVGG
jgi:hypothetical protein